MLLILIRMLRRRAVGREEDRNYVLRPEEERRLDRLSVVRMLEKVPFRFKVPVRQKQSHASSISPQALASPSADGGTGEFPATHKRFKHHVNTRGFQENPNENDTFFGLFQGNNSAGPGF